MDLEELAREVINTGAPIQGKLTFERDDKTLIEVRVIMVPEEIVGNGPGTIICDEEYDD